jgi:hypothetical protein
VDESQRGLEGVVVSDGRSSVRTSASGQFELVGNGDARFVFASPPDGFAIPRNESGTARLYRPLDVRDRDGEATVNFALARDESLADANAHSFLVFGDTQLGLSNEARMFRRETIEEVRKRSASERFAFGVTCGDIVDDELSLFSEYQSAVGEIEAPFFQAIGNHDFDVQGTRRSVSTFERYFGPTHFSFERDGVHYVVLNDVVWLEEGYVGKISEEQLGWLQGDLELVERGATVVVFAHIPFLSTISERIGGRIAEHEARVSNRELLHALLEPFRAHLLTSHTHDNEHLFHGGCHEHVLGTVCGAWWSGPVCWDGTPKGYHVFRCSNGSLSWRFYATGLGEDTQLRAYAPGSDGSRARDLVANVWNWDPEWQVNWYQDGEPRGEMRRARGLDPLTVSLYEGPTQPAKSSDWVEPVPTDHLFYATPSDDARTVTVEATDREGRVFHESVRMS